MKSGTLKASKCKKNKQDFTLPFSIGRRFSNVKHKQRTMFYALGASSCQIRPKVGARNVVRYLCFTLLNFRPIENGSVKPCLYSFLSFHDPPAICCKVQNVRHISSGEHARNLAIIFSAKSDNDKAINFDFQNKVCTVQ